MHRDLDKSHKLALFGKELLNKPSIEEGLPMIASYAVELLNCERCSVFVYDQKTQKGDLLLKMNTSKLKISLRELKSSYIKARQRYNEVANWEKSSEVSRAKRSFIKAKSSL